MKAKLWFIFLLLLAFSVHGALLIETGVIDNSIYLDEQARFSLKIENTDAITKVVQVYSTDVEWNIELEPYFSTIPPKSSMELELKLLPSVWASPGSKKVNVFVESPNTNEKIVMQLPVNVKSFDEVKKEYNPSVELRVTFEESIDPRLTIPVEVYLRNRNRLDIKVLELNIKNQLFSEYKVIQLGPLAETREKFFFNIDELTPPTEDELDVLIIVANRTINRERIKFNVIPYSIFTKKEDTIEELFKKTTTFSIMNEGNVNKVDSFRVPTTFFKKFFTGTDPGPTRVELKKNPYFEWDLNLDPKEEMTIKFVVNYRPIIYLILIGIVVSLIYFIYRSPIIIKKEALITGSTQDSISEMKVLLHVRNRSQDLIEKIQITDLIPSIADLITDSHIGSLAPSKVIKHQKRGTIIKWELDAIEPFEERIISYRLKSKIAIVGGFTLPRAKVKFETYKGKERVVRSNKSSISLGL